MAIMICSRRNLSASASPPLPRSLVLALAASVLSILIIVDR